MNEINNTYTLNKLTVALNERIVCIYVPYCRRTCKYDKQANK